MSRRKIRTRRFRKISAWDGPLHFSGATGPYVLYRVDAHVDHDTYVDHGAAVVFADSTDEHSDQNVNWEVGLNGSPAGRGHARTIRKAKAHALVALRKALRIGSR